MNENQNTGRAGRRTARAAGWRLGIVVLGLLVSWRADAAPNLLVWDTGAGSSTVIDAANRTHWNVVPAEPFVLEADPAKAASDPGYYGREYTFKGDAVVENRSMTVVFRSAAGRVLLYSKMTPTLPAPQPSEAANPGVKVLELVPLTAGTVPAKISRFEVIRNAGDQVVVGVSFAVPGSGDVSAVFTFGRNEVVEVQTSGMKGFRLFGAVDYGLLPGFIGDDLIFNPADFAAVERLFLPADNTFLGLLRGEDHQFVMTWPKGRQELTLPLVNDSGGKRRIESVDFENDGQGFNLAVLSAPGIWHRETLKPAHLEKDVSPAWKRPFPAKWKTQLTESGVRTSYAFRDAPSQIWRGVPGSYTYPVWFDGDKAIYHLSKKVPPKGESLIYFLEGQETPVSVTTPVDVISATLGRPLSSALFDVAGRKLRTHHRRGGEGVHRACTCGCTEAIQSIFEAGQEVTRKNEIQEALSDMNYFVERHVARIEEYRKFAGETLRYLQAQRAGSPALKPYLESLEQIARQIPEEYDVQKENMRSPEHARELTRQTMALTAGKSPTHVAEFMELLKAWRAMGGAQDYVIAQCHMIARKLFQEAGYGGVQDARTAAVAGEVRARCRQILRNPDGYEIWGDY